MTLSIRQHAEQMLAELPPAGVAELVSFIEFLHFKYLGPAALEPTTITVTTNLTQDSGHTIDEALGLLATEQPAPSDSEVEQWLEEHRMEKYYSYSHPRRNIE